MMLKGRVWSIVSKPLLKGRAAEQPGKTSCTHESPQTPDYMQLQERIAAARPAPRLDLDAKLATLACPLHRADRLRQSVDRTRGRARVDDVEGPGLEHCLQASHAARLRLC